MKKIALALTIISILALAPRAYAHDEEARGGQHFFFRLSSQNQSEDEEGGEDENEFHVRGQIESMTEGSIVVNGITILLDPSQVDEFKQKGILNEGDWVKVEGVVLDGKYYAEEVMAIGEGQGRFQIKIDSEDKESEDEDLSPTPTATESPSPTPTESVSPTPTESISPTESPSPTPTETALNAQVSVKAEGPIGVVAEFLQQVLAYLQGLIS